MAGTTISRMPARWALSLLVASLTAWATITVWMLIPAYSDSEAVSGIDPYSSGALFNAILLFAIFGIPVAAGCCFVFGVPMLLLANRYRLSLWWHAVLFGLLGGLAIAALWSATLLRSASTQVNWLDFVATCSATGATAGYFAWLVLRSGRTDT